MSAGVAGLVLFAALLHGGWNALGKAIPDRLVSSTLIGLAYLVVGSVGCLIFPVPDRAAWPALAATMVLQTAYMILLMATYARTEFSRAYPLTRGVAVIGVTIISVVFLGERLTVLQMFGIALVAGALLALALVNGGREDSRTLGLAVLVGLIVAAYSLVDGTGVRVAGTVLGYVSWMFFLQGLAIPVVCWFLCKDRPALAQGLRQHWLLGSLGGVLSLVAYGIVVWAQSVAPLALVSALRETGVLMAAFIGFVAFKERLTVVGIGATVVAAAGIVLLRIAA